jgi:hypothetical protein
MQQVEIEIEGKKKFYNVFTLDYIIVILNYITLCIIHYNLPKLNMQ